MTYAYRVNIDGIELELETGENCFSPKSADKGTLAMLSLCRIKPGEKILDLGCGCGIVGIWCAKIVGGEKVFMTDILPEATEIAKKNALKNCVENVTVVCGNGLEAVEENDFDMIMSNPPYHTDFSVAKSFIEKGFNRLKIGGRMVMVTKRLDWYKNKLTAVFGGCKVNEADGYYVFEAIKRSDIRRDVEKAKQKKKEKQDSLQQKKVPKRFRK